MVASLVVASSVYTNTYVTEKNKTIFKIKKIEIYVVFSVAVMGIFRVQKQNSRYSDLIDLPK